MELKPCTWRNPLAGKISLPPVAVALPGNVTGVGQSRVRTVTFAITVPDVRSTTGKALKEKMYLPVPLSKLTRSLNTALTVNE